METILVVIIKKYVDTQKQVINSSGIVKKTTSYPGLAFMFWMVMNNTTNVILESIRN